MATSFFYIYAMATSFFYIYVMATSFFYLYVMDISSFYIYVKATSFFYIYKSTERPVVLLNAIFQIGPKKAPQSAWYDRYFKPRVTNKRKQFYPNQPNALTLFPLSIGE